MLEERDVARLESQQGKPKDLSNPPAKSEEEKSRNRLECQQGRPDQRLPKIGAAMEENRDPEALNRLQPERPNQLRCPHYGEGR